MSRIVFEVDGETYTREGEVPVSKLIAEATSDFGQIHLQEQHDTDLTMQHISVLSSLEINLNVCINQLDSLDDDFPMTNTREALTTALAKVQKALGDLRGRLG